ncbi:starch synthase 3, chloroplastic/amyloplastic [Apium graveolens]|uniref:starch synthase 3, chloroplastic/amyloplastic n=1 Tax=Apium graveolens TaxID=4045 RepID=UPI003D7B84B4
MEVSLLVQRPVWCRNVYSDAPHLKLNPFLGFSRTLTHSTQSSSIIGNRAAGLLYRISATADFSRRRSGKASNPRPEGSTSKRFSRKPQIRTNNQRKSQKGNDKREGSGTPASNEYATHNVKAIKLNVDTDEEKTVEINQATKVEEGPGTGGIVEKVKNLSHVGKLTKSTENGRIGTVDEVSSRSANVKQIAKTDVSEAVVYIGGLEIKNLDVEIDGLEQTECANIDDNVTSKIGKPEFAEGRKIFGNTGKKEDDYSLQEKLEMEAKAREQALQRLSGVNFSLGNKMFCYPEEAKPGQTIEVFLNKSLSTLNSESDLIIMGAFNDWRWKSFTFNLNKTCLNGDWWSCQVHVPKEAYKMDFVFFNGKNVYDNNDKKDYYIPIMGGMDVLEFEEFLLEEKRRELEKHAKEQAEKERYANELRRIEEEKQAREADRAQARGEAERRREMLQGVIKKAVTSVHNLWFIEPEEFRGEDIIKLYYNRSSGPLANAKQIWIHGGYNNWKDGLSIVARLDNSERKDGDWWHTNVVVPDRALVLDWVFADGPPQHALIYDNNHRHDFHAIVPARDPENKYWIEEENEIYKKLQEERTLREEAVRAKAERTARLKSETKERTMKTFLLSQKDIVYTEPLDVHAGSAVSLFYNPSNTVLNGKPEVWLRCSFNRWTHRMGTLQPQKMVPAENSSHVTAKVKVPLDAYMMDFVLSEREDGGVFDNKLGMDYHIPVFGGIAKEPPMHIVHIAVEMAPIAKVGGLGDVVTSLSRAVQDLNHTVDIIFPKYDCLNLSNVEDFHFHKSYFWGGTEIKVWFGKVEGLSVYFLEPQNGLFWTGCIYGCKNDGDRFGFFCHAALEYLLQSGSNPDIIHCHDWSSAPVAWLFKDHYMQYGLSKARVVFTIHNLEFGAHLIGKAMAYADKATTVSPTYSQEVSGNSAIAPHLYKFHGILNGIDPDIWDPYNDNVLPVCYTSENVVEGKRAAKEALQQKLGLKRADLPLVGIITRLTHQKGIHLIKHAIWRTLDRGGQVVLLGSAPDPRIQNDFVNMANHLHSSHNDRARLCLTYDEPLSHLIYAGADFILVPSIFEPCGLTQLTAMRYGSIPIVRKTGGLYDTVFDVDHDKERAQARGLEPNGFNFEGADAAGVDYAVNRAMSAWYEGRDWFNSLCKLVMEQDWSWNRPALDYLELYHAARKL